MVAATGNASGSQGEHRSMIRRNRTLRLIAMLVLLAGALVSLIGPVIPVQAQDEGSPAAAPPELPVEIVFEDRHFLFDREIPIAPEGLSEVGRQNDLTFYAESAEGPDDRLFVSSPLDQTTVTRYLPEIPVDADGTAQPNSCPAQPQEFGDLQGEDGVYAYAGTEPDVPIDGLARLPQPPRDSRFTLTRSNNRLSNFSWIPVPIWSASSCWMTKVDRQFLAMHFNFRM
jgi:hypothetical protein